MPELRGCHELDPNGAWLRPLKSSQICPNGCPSRQFFLDCGKRIDDPVRTQEYWSLHRPYLMGGYGVRTTSPSRLVRFGPVPLGSQLGKRVDPGAWLHS